MAFLRTAELAVTCTAPLVFSSPETFPLPKHLLPCPSPTQLSTLFNIVHDFFGKEFLYIIYLSPAFSPLNPISMSKVRDCEKENI